MRRHGSGLGLLLAALWVAPLGAQQPTGTIRGQVIDESSKRPLQGVSVTFAGKTAVTAATGRYAMAVPAGSGTLTAKILGYAPVTQEVRVAEGEVVVVDLRMTAQAVQLTEIVATGYGEQRKADITGAVSKVNQEEFNPGRNVSPALLIQNKVPGVQVVDNNEPGGGLSLRIRGATSVNASSEPLVVINGVPVGTGAGGGISAGRDALNFLAPDDIESITVLRDASAAAIYGANGASGVLLITTKSGKGGPSFEYSGNVSSSQVTRLPSMMNAEQFRAAVQTYAPQNAGQLLDASTDWLGEVTGAAFGTEHNFAISGAGQANDYRLSFNFLDQDGIVTQTNLQRLALGVSYNQRLFNDRLSVRFNLNGSRVEDQFTPGGVLSNAAQMGPTQPIFDETTETGFYDWPGNTLTSADNPLAIAQLATDFGTTFRSYGNVQAKYNLPWVQGLAANVSLGYDVTKAEREQFFPSTLHNEQKTGTDGTLIQTNPSLVNGILETYLGYNASRAGPGTLELTGGYSYQTSNGDYPRLFLQQLSTDLLGSNAYPTAQTVQNTRDIQDSKLISFYGRANYNINDKYLFAASLRRDGSSRFGEDNAWGTFPSVAAAWRLSQESFLSGTSWLSDLKLRGSWAKTGNQAFANYQQYTSFTVGDAQSQYPIDGQFVPTIRPSAVDPNIKWEETTSWNFGLDFGFANNRITGTIDVYDKKTEDMIFTVPVAAGTNLSNFVTTNIGSMKNTGVEFLVRAEVLRGGSRKLNWTADFNLSYNDNELTAINPNATTGQEILVGAVAGGVGTTVQVLTPGQPVNAFYVYQHIRGADGRPIYEDTNGDGTINQNDLYVDQNDDGVINVDDRVASGQAPLPKWILGHSSYLTYGKFDFGFTLRAYTGNYVYNNVASNLGTYAEVGRASPYNLHTSVLETGFEQPQYLSDYYVEDASFLRMDNLTAGYSFRIRGQNARVFLTAQNVFTITGYSGVDPTAGLNGIDNNIYPRSRTFTGGLSLRL